jgi:hypothetical protein
MRSRVLQPKSFGMDDWFLEDFSAIDQKRSIG